MHDPPGLCEGYRMLPRGVGLALWIVAVGCGSGSPAQVPDAGPFSPPVAEGCIDQVGAGDHEYLCNQIHYQVSVPESCLARPCGIIADVHGFSMSAAMEEANTRLAARGKERGYIVVQPSANPAPPLSSWAAYTDDEKVFTFLLQAARVWHADPARIHVTGFSQGGAMVWRLICTHADVIASAAPAAETDCSFAGRELPSRKLDILYMHGTEDALVSFNDKAVPQVGRVVAAWGMDDGVQIAGDEKWSRRRYTSPEGTVLEFIQHGYVARSCLVRLDGHCYPGSTDPGNQPGQACSFACVGPNAFDWGGEIIAFFEAHPLR